MACRSTAGAAADVPVGRRRVHDGGHVLLAGMVYAAGCSDHGRNIHRADWVRVHMMGWICYLVSRLKAAWKALEKAAERQRNYWDGDAP